MKKIYKIIIGIVAVLLIAAIIICISEGKKPKVKYDSAIMCHTIEYKGKTYYPIGSSTNFSYKSDKVLKKTFLYSIGSVKNDNNNDFLTYTEWQYHEMFTDINDYEGKYPYGVCDESRVTSIRLQNGSNNITEYDSTSKKLNDIFLHPEKYSDLTQAKYPLRHSAGFSCMLYAFMDNMPVSTCMIGRLAYYDGKWIFVAKDTEVEGTADKSADTRTFTGIVINNPEAVKILDQYSKEKFNYMLNN